MSVTSVFIGDDIGERIGFISDCLKFERDIGKKTIMIADSRTLGLVKDAYVLSSGYAQDCPVDLAMEVLYAVGNTEKGAEILSRLLVSDEDIRNAKEPFWERCARRVLVSVTKTAAQGHMNRRFKLREHVK